MVCGWKTVTWCHWQAVFSCKRWRTAAAVCCWVLLYVLWVWLRKFKFSSPACDCFCQLCYKWLLTSADIPQCWKQLLWTDDGKRPNGVAVLTRRRTVIAQCWISFARGHFGCKSFGSGCFESRHFYKQMPRLESPISFWNATYHVFSSFELSANSCGWPNFSSLYVRQEHDKIITKWNKYFRLGLINYLTWNLCRNFIIIE